MKRIFVKPNAGRVLDELNREIPACGCEVNKTTFISRLIKEGALTEVTEPEAAKPKKKDGDK